MPPTPPSVMSSAGPDFPTLGALAQPSYVPLDLAAVAQAAQAETGVRQAGAQQLAAAALASRLAQQNAGIAADREAQTRQYSFADEQRRLDEAVQRSLLQARMQSAADEDRNIAEQRAYEQSVRDSENREWYSRQRFMAGLEARREASRRRQAQEDHEAALEAELEASFPRLSDFGNSTTNPFRGQALIREGQRRPSVQRMRGFRDWEDIEEILEDHDETERHAAMDEVRRYFRERGNGRRSDEMASIALWELVGPDWAPPVAGQP